MTRIGMTAADRPRFSVVVPAYDEADVLDVTLDALLRQDFTEGYEVIVVDNASHDATADVARRAGVRVLHEPVPGVCAARQRGVDGARGEIVVSTDADTVVPQDWLTRFDAQFRSHPEVVAVAGPCRYHDPPGWVAVFAPLSFAVVGALYRLVGHVAYLTATNVAFYRSGFPGYDLTLTQGGDEVDLLRRLRGVGPVRWDRHNVVTTSSRRLDQGMAYTLVVSYGYYYALALLVNRATARRVIGVAPPVRPRDHARVRTRRRRWGRSGAVVCGVVVSTALRRRVRVRLQRGVGR